MSHWEPTVGASDEWYTPKYIFDAMASRFDLDVAAPKQPTHVPCVTWRWADGLEYDWTGHFVWMNAPFGGRNGLEPWLNKFFEHGDGVCLTPDRTSAGWFQSAMKRADLALLLHGKVKFERPDGSVGKQPSSGTVPMAAGNSGERSLVNAEKRGLGLLVRRAIFF